MKKSLALLSVILGLTISSTSFAAEQNCQMVITSIKNEWKAVDYGTPSKPTEVRVQGKMGHENSAGQIAYMQDQITKADADCKAGNQQAAVQRVSDVRDLLDSHGMNPQTASAAMVQQ